YEKLARVELQLRVHGVVMRTAQVDRVLRRPSLLRRHARVIARAARARRSDVRDLPSRLGAVTVSFRVDRQIQTAARVSALVAASGNDYLLLGGGHTVPQRSL